MAFDLRGVLGWTNDFLDSSCGIDKTLIDMSEKMKVTGQLFISPANNSTKAIQDILTKDRKWHMRALGRLLSLRESLLRELNFDYILLDIGSGISYPAINAIVAADTVIIVNTPDEIQNLGTLKVLQELYALFDKKTGMIINKVNRGQKNFSDIESLKTIEFETKFNLPVLGVVPCFCDLNEKSLIHPFQLSTNHLYPKLVIEIAAKIESFISGQFIESNKEMMRVYREQFLKKVYGFIT